MAEPATMRPDPAANAVAETVGRTSRVSLIFDNLAAFALRALGARNAARTLDLQYYFWAEDLTGQLLAREVLQAADRGVEVRILLDDLYVRRAVQRDLLELTRHPKIEIRLYNPFQLRAFGLLGDAVEFLFASYRLNHRMHNKAWIVDGDLVIAGGRNIGDEYFDAASQFNFRDLDIRVSGPAALEARTIFNRYWYHPRVRPIGEVATLRLDDGGLAALRDKLEAATSSVSAPAYLERALAAATPSGTELDGESVVVATEAVRLAADPPGKSNGRRRDRRVYDAILQRLDAARSEIFLISPYFVPGRAGSRMLITLARRGVKIAVLTNSLAATDVLAVHGRYARYRKRLLRRGIRIYELKRGGQEGRSLFGSAGASLHTKAFVVDRRLAFVGSFNFDPRSANLNTEMGAFVDNEELARSLRAEFFRLTDPRRSWHVRLEEGEVRWGDETREGADETRNEPDTSYARRLIARVLGWLPLEPHL